MKDDYQHSYNSNTTKETLLDLETHLQGDLSFNSALTLKGQFEGTITSDGYLTIEDTATVKANIKVASLELRGKLYSDAKVQALAEFSNTSTFMGNIEVGSIKMEAGAIFQGHIGMLKDATQLDLFSASPEQLKKLAIEQQSK